MYKKIVLSTILSANIFANVDLGEIVVTATKTTQKI